MKLRMLSKKNDKSARPKRIQRLADAILNGPRQHGLYVNTLKVRVEEFMKLSPFRLEPVPWAAGGFYISGEDMPGRHAHYHAGLYYTGTERHLPAQALDAKPGERCWTVCRTGRQIGADASAMQGKGLLFSNDISADRVKALVKSMELCGVRNVVVLNEAQEAGAAPGRVFRQGAGGCPVFRGRHVQKGRNGRQELGAFWAGTLCKAAGADFGLCGQAFKAGRNVGLFHVHVFARGE